MSYRVVVSLFTFALTGTLMFSYGNTGCGGFAEGVHDLTSFCKAVGEKCSKQTASDCVNKLGGDNAVLKSNPDYKGAKACLDALSSCTELPNSCWFYAVERFKEAPPAEPSTADAGTTD